MSRAFDINWKVPVALPTVVALPAPVAILVVPVEERSVKAPVPGVVAPIEGKVAAPAPEIFQLRSLSTRSEEVAFPMVTVPIDEPVPILVADDPVVLILVVPAIVAPPVAVNSPPRVTLSQSVAVVRVEVALFLDQ
jgi:hypothetical protein